MKIEHDAYNDIKISAMNFRYRSHWNAMSKYI